MNDELTDEQKQVLLKIAEKCMYLGVNVKFVGPPLVGPIITSYRFQLSGSTKIAQFENISEDIALGLGVENVMIKRMPGDNAISVFVPNRNRTPVKWRDLIQMVFTAKTVGSMHIPLYFGVNERGALFVEDLADLPHLLVAGQTGGGKSTLLNSLLSTLMNLKTSKELRLVLSDTKGTEFHVFKKSRFLEFGEVATTVYQTLEQLEAVVQLVEARLKRFGGSGLRDLDEWNQYNPGETMPRVMVVIDELADLMQYGGKKRGESKLADEKIAKIVARARAAGVHMLAATQRPSVDVVAGSIKANFTARLTFKLPAEQDSRTVLGTNGAEHLLDKGDMLYKSSTRPGIIRLHSALATRSDIQGCVEAANMAEEMRRLGGDL
jgi:S-DNA-T family DNA segregation ATPase FtsK/SpoIIIE